MVTTLLGLVLFTKALNLARKLDQSNWELDDEQIGKLAIAAIACGGALALGFLVTIVGCFSVYAAVQLITGSFEVSLEKNI